MMSIRYFGSALVLLALLFPFIQETAPCCTIIDIKNDSGIVLIRHTKSGWIKSFKPAALEFAELNIGDSVDASIVLQQVSRVRKTPHTYPLRNPFIGQACCKVLELKKDSMEAIVMARNIDGGDLRFSVPDSLAGLLPPGHDVYTSPTHGFAMFLAPLANDSASKIIYGFPLLQNVQDSLP